MFQKVELQGLSLQEIQEYKAKAEQRKAELEALKVKGGKAWNPGLQDELDDAVLFLVDVEDALEEKKPGEAAPGQAYVPKKGTEKLVHLSVVKGLRFNAMTGKEESKPYVQMFTFAEWQLFKKHFTSLGYSIVKVLHDPYGEAEKFVMKKD